MINATVTKRPLLDQMLADPVLLHDPKMWGRVLAILRQLPERLERVQGGMAAMGCATDLGLAGLDRVIDNTARLVLELDDDHDRAVRQ